VGSLFGATLLINPGDTSNNAIVYQDLANNSTLTALQSSRQCSSFEAIQRGGVAT
jgi:hypothetical protein